MHWKVGRIHCTFKVRIRRGWPDLREFLAQVRACSRCAGRLPLAPAAPAPPHSRQDSAHTPRARRPPTAALPSSLQNADRFSVFVCSKGKREYIQLLWLMLDPLGQLIPQSGACRAARAPSSAARGRPKARSRPPPAPADRCRPPVRADWAARLTSTFPDALAQAANKTALTALGCYDITKPHVPTQLAAPMMCLDDSTGAPRVRCQPPRPRSQPSARRRVAPATLARH